MRMVLAALALGAVVGACNQDATAPRQQMAMSRAAAASYEVGFTSYMIHDAARGNRPIPVYVWYPVAPGTITSATPEAQYPLEPFHEALPLASSSDFEKYGLGRAYQEPTPAAGPFPIIMFSPGWGGMAYSDALYLGTAAARYGVVLAAVTHWGDQSAPILLADEPYDHVALASYNRPRDISAALTDLLEKNGTPGHLLHGLMDPAQVIASGWSLGGYASIVLAAGDDGVCDLADVFPGWPIPPEACGPTPADPRIGRIIPLDGSGWLMWFSELERVRVPVLGIGEEWGMVDSWLARQHAAYSGRPNYRVDVNRTVHQSFSNWCETFHVWWDHGITVWWDPAGDYYNSICQPAILPPSEAHRLVNEYVKAFLTGQQSVLTPGFALTSEPDIEFFVTEKRNPNALTEDWPGNYAYFMHQPGRATSNAVLATARKDPTGPIPVRFGHRSGRGPAAK